MSKNIIRISVVALILIAFAFPFFFNGCTPDPGTDNTTGGPVPNTTGDVVTKPHVTPPVFSGDSAFTFTKAQADMGPRTPGSKAHAAFVKYAEEKFKSYGAEVIIQTAPAKSFDGKQWKIENIIAQFNPSAANRILLSAHYDSRPFCDRDSIMMNKTRSCPGVNDGASGVAVLMEVARNISIKKPELGIDIILFDLEDYGDSGSSDSWCLGSQYWASNLHKPNYFARFGILLDMVGAKGATFPREEKSVYSAGSFVNKIWLAAENIGQSKYFINQSFGPITDDHVPVNDIANIPCVDILGYDMVRGDFFPHHHRASDDMSNIDKETLKAVGQTLLEVIYNESN